MPRIENISTHPTSNNQSFKKKSYRPWNLLDDDFNIGKQQTEQTKTGDKAITNQGQTEDKSRTNKGQLEDKARTINTNRGQNGVRIEDVIENKLRTNWRQLEDKEIDFFSLSGLQKSITIHIYNVCKISRDRVTPPISLELIASNCNTTPLSAKKTLQRLEKKSVIVRSKYKSGRGGWTSYCLPNNVFQKILYMESENKARTNQGQIKDKLETEARTETRTTFSSSGSINNYINTTTGEHENLKLNNLNDEWLKINIGPLSSIGFTKTHLTQIASQNILPAESVQNSIYAFAFDLQENNKAKNIKGDPINFFMGILRNGKPYAPSSNYESPQDKAMRIYRERMREIEQGRVAAEKEAINLAYNDWFAQLTDAQKKEFLPVSLRQNARLEKNKILEGSARNHFETEIWPDKKQEIIGKTSAIEREVNGKEITNNST